MARGHHDIGGLPGAGAIDQSEHQLSDWEILVDAVNQALGARRIKRTDEMRRARKEMDSAAYRDMAYYEHWIASIETILIEKKMLSKEEIDRKLSEFEAKWGEPCFLPIGQKLQLSTAFRGRTARRDARVWTQAARRC